MLRYTFFAALLLVAPIGIRSAHSQAASGSYVGSVPAHDDCPAVTLHVIGSGLSGSGGSKLTGVIFYTDGSGVSNINGEITGGRVHFTMTPAGGRGVSGEVEGTLANGRLQIHSVKNPHCGLDTYLSTIPGVGGGGG